MSVDSPTVAPLRWGLLGTARVNRLIIPAIRTSARSVVHAVASRDADRARGYAAIWAIPRAFASYDEMLASDLDIVYISLPNSLHVPWTLRAVEAGKHVLCEKPLALTADEVRRVADASTRCGRIVTEAFMYRHHAQTKRIADLIEGGAIGSVRTLVGGFTYMRSRSPDVRLDATLGGGSLWDVGCYPVSFGQHVAGAPARSALATQQLGPTGVDEHFAGTLTYANGVTMQFHSGFRAIYDTLMRIVGSEGVLDIPRPYRPATSGSITLRRGEAVEQIHITGSAPFVDEVIDMETAVRGERPARVTLEESRVLAATLVALRISARELRRIDVEQ